MKIWLNKIRFFTFICTGFSRDFYYLSYNASYLICSLSAAAALSEKNQFLTQVRAPVVNFIAIYIYV